MNGLEDLQVLTMEHVKLSLEFLYVLGKLLEALDHELGTVVTEILVFLGVDLRVVEDENRGDFLIFLHLSDESSIIDEAKITVEEEYIHLIISSNNYHYVYS